MLLPNWLKGLLPRVVALEAGGSGPSVATGAEVTTGTNNTKFASPLALADAGITASGKTVSLATNAANVTAGSAVTLLDFGSVTFDGTQHIFQCSCAYVDVNSANTNMELYIDGAAAGSGTTGSINGTIGIGLHGRVVLTPSAGSHTVKFVANKVSGTSAIYYGAAADSVNPIVGTITKK